MQQSTFVEAGKVQCLSRTLVEIHRLSREVPLGDFLESAFRTLHELIRFDSGYWGGGALGAPPVLRYSSLYNLPTEEMNADFDKVKSHPKMVEMISFLAMNAGQAHSFSTRESGTGFFWEPYGVDQIVSCYHHDADLGLYHIFSLYRGGEERFTEQECMLFENTTAHLLEAWRESNLRHLAGAAEPHSLIPAAALLDWEGGVHFARPAFTKLLREEWPDWHGPFIPAVMRKMCEGSFSGRKISMRFSQLGSLYLAVGRRNGLLDQLTGREMEIAKQLASGQSYKEIADNLGIAPNTVRNHISQIFKKLGCSKGSQVAVIFQNEGWY